MNMLISKRDALEDEVSAMIQFNEDHHNHIDQMVTTIKELKETQRKKETEIQDLRDKFRDKEQEEALVKHSLREVQDQGVFIEKDQAKVIAHRDQCQNTYHDLMRVNRDIQNELDFMLKVDKNMV